MQQAKVIRSAGVVGLFTFLSRILGLIREILMAGFFGTSGLKSAFDIAFTFPNLFRRLFGEGALSAAFVPVFVKSRKREGDHQAWVLARKIITLAVIVLLTVVLVGIGIMSWAMRCPWSENVMITLSLLRVMLPYMIFICLVALSMGILNSFHRFAVPAATPCVLNVVWIATVLFICPFLDASMEVRIHAVAWGVLVAGGLQLAMQLPALRKTGYRLGWSIDLKDPRVIRVLTLMGPAALGLAVMQVNVMVDRLLAAWVGPWAPAALTYSERLIYLPLGIFVTALSTVLLPTFSSYTATENRSEFNETINHSLRNVVFVMVPASVGLFVLAGPIVEMVYEWGEFTQRSTMLTKRALQCYAPGLLVFSLTKIFVPAFYARKDTKTPVKTGLVTVGFNVVLSVSFILILPSDWKHGGIALATVVAGAVYSTILAIILYRGLGSPGWGSVLKGFFRCLGGSVLMGGVVLWTHGTIVEICRSVIPMPKAVHIVSVMGAILLAVGVYVIWSLLVRSPELREVWNAIRSRSYKGSKTDR